VTPPALQSMITPRGGVEPREDTKTNPQLSVQAFALLSPRLPEVCWNVFLSVSTSSSFCCTFCVSLYLLTRTHVAGEERYIHTAAHHTLRGGENENVLSFRRYKVCCSTAQL